MTDVDYSGLEITIDIVYSNSKVAEFGFDGLHAFYYLSECSFVAWWEEYGVIDNGIFYKIYLNNMLEHAKKTDLS